MPILIRIRFHDRFMVREIHVDSELWREYERIAGELGHKPGDLLPFVLEKYVKHLRRKIGVD